MWHLSQLCQMALRYGIDGRPLGYDLGTVMQAGAALGIDAATVAWLLPNIEAGLIQATTEARDGR